MESDDRYELQRWFDGELPDTERRRVADEIRERPELARSAGFLRTVRESIRARSRIRPSPGLTDRIMAAVFPGGAEPVWIVIEPFVKRLALAASMLLLVSLGIWIVFSGPSRDRLTGGPIRPSAIEREMLGHRAAPPGEAFPSLGSGGGFVHHR